MKLYGRQDKTNWMSEGKYGVFFHYLYDMDDMKKFDAKKFAENVNSMGAAWAVITLGQNEGYYCAPNPTYEKLTGYAPKSKCYEGDIPMQIAKELEKYNIKMMLYLPSHAPSRDLQAGRMLGSDMEIDGNWAMNDTIVHNWCEVIKDWSCHYGKLCAGWWFDGFYSLIHLDEHYGKFYKEAVMSGNEDVLLALNQGVFEDVFPANKYCDYTAGEFNEFYAEPKERFVDGSQWHVLSFLGDDWLAGNSKYTGEFMTEYIRKANAKGGAVTVNLHIEPDGGMTEEQLAVMREVKKNIR